MKRFIYIGFLLMLASVKTIAQQDEKFSQYMFNQLLFNPASAGSSGYINFKTAIRNQWVGIEGHPSTKLLSVDGCIPKLRNKVGLGVVISKDEAGASATNLLSGSLAYRIRLSDSSWLSFGGTYGLRQRILDPSKITHKDPTDVAFPQDIASVLSNDFKLGVYYYSTDKFYGFSATNVIPSNINYTGIARPETGKETIHFYLTAGYFFEINNNFRYKQIFLAKSDLHSQVQVDFTPMISYKKNYDLGISYRYQQSVVGIFQVTILDQLKLGLALDFETQDLASSENGTNEIMISYSLIPNKRIMYNPRYF